MFESRLGKEIFANAHTESASVPRPTSKAEDASAVGKCDSFHKNNTTIHLLLVILKCMFSMILITY